MKKLGIAAIAALMGLPAFAADMPYKAPPPPPPPLCIWCGFYVGVNAAYGWGNRSVAFTPNDPLSTILFNTLNGAPPPLSFGTSGGAGGLQLGYNWQVDRSWVLGVEADIDASNVKGSGSSTSVNTFGIPFSETLNERITSFGTVRGRLGYLPTDNLLVYLTGGFAYGRVENTGSYVPSGGFNAVDNADKLSYVCTAGSPCFAGSSTKGGSGLTLGGGLEYALVRNVSLKAEYLYVNLGSRSVTQTAVVVIPAFPGPASFNSNFSQTTLNVVRVGVNYHF